MSLSDNTTEITRYDNSSGSLSEYYVGMKMEKFRYVTEGFSKLTTRLFMH